MSDESTDKDKQPAMPERIDAFAKKLMGYKPRKDPRKHDGPLFATFQDRVVASVVDVGLIYIALQGVFNGITARVFSMANVAAVQKVRSGASPDASQIESIRYFVEGAFESGLAQLWLLNSTLQSLVIGGVLMFMWCKFHCTLGKYLIGLEFAGRNGEGKPTTKQYALRFAGFYLSMPVFMIGFAYLGIDKKKRAWHDMIAGTTVVYSKRGSIFRQTWDALKSALKRG